jgi:SAM-dependent methyltransferase
MSFSPDHTRSVEDSLAVAEAWLKAKKIPRQYRIVTEIMAKVDRDRLSFVLAKYTKTPPPGGFMKYLDMPYWLARFAQRAAVLDLDGRKPGAVLDLGAGGGHWLAVCKHYGWRCTAVDMKNAVVGENMAALPFYEDLAALLGIRRYIHRILPGRPLRPLNRKFDLITAFLAFFHEIWDGQNRRAGQFTIADWRYFLNDIVARHMRFPATLHLELNRISRSESGEHFHDPEMLAWFAAQGATLGLGQNPGAVTFDFTGPRRF